MQPMIPAPIRTPNVGISASSEGLSHTGQRRPVDTISLYASSSGKDSYSPCLSTSVEVDEVQPVSLISKTLNWLPMKGSYVKDGVSGSNSMLFGYSQSTLYSEAARLDV